MINAKIIRRDSKIISISLNGHAGSVDEGYDMVCSAVSAVSLSIANGITEILHINPEISLEDGFLSLDLQANSPEDIEKCQVLLATMELGLNSLELSYGDYITVRIEEV